MTFAGFGPDWPQLRFTLPSSDVCGHRTICDVCRLRTGLAAAASPSAVPRSDAGAVREVPALAPRALSGGGAGGPRGELGTSRWSISKRARISSFWIKDDESDSHFGIISERYYFRY